MQRKPFHLRFVESGGEGGSSNEGGNTNASENTPGAGEEFKPITSQDALNEALKERLSRERAKFKDYGDLKAKASRLDEIEAANKSEAQKLAEAKAALEQERDAARAEALRLRVATKHGISDEDADLFLTGTDEETLTKQAERLSARASDRKKQGNHVPAEGANPKPSESDERATVRNLFGSGG